MTAAITPPQQQSIFARFSATIGHHHHPHKQSSSAEQKIAQMRAAYSDNGTGGKQQPKKADSTSSPRPSLSFSSLPTQRHPEMLDSNYGSLSRRSSAIANCLPSPSIMELAKWSGLLSLNPSDLVFESSVLGIAYYDFVLSVCEVELASAAGVDDGCCEPPSASLIKQQQKAQSDISSTKKGVTKRRVHETGSAPLDRTSSGMSTNDSQNETMTTTTPMQRKRGQTIEKGGGRTLVAKLNRQRTDQQMNNNNAKDNNNNKGLSSILQNFEKCSMSEIQEENDSRRRTASQSAPMVSAENIIKKEDNNKNGYRIFLAKFDANTNVQWFESVLVSKDLLEKNGIPVNQLSLLTMGILVWRCTLNNARLLCLVNGMQQQQQMPEDGNTTAASFEALKRAACKYKCMHHVLTIGQRRTSAGSTHSSCSSSSRRSSCTSVSRAQNQQETGMRLRLLMCQSRSELPEVPSQAIRETKFLLSPSSNPLLCLCFPLT